MFEFAWPWVFVLLPLPLLIWRFVPVANHQQSALRTPFYSRAASLSTTTATGTSNNSFTRLLAVLCWLLLIGAAAKPQWVGETVKMPATGRDLLLAVDISGSMEERDMAFEGRRYPRIAVVKQIVGDFVERRKGDRLGLVVFGSQAFLLSPLTFDTNTVKTLLVEDTRISFAGPKTAIGDAIGLSIKRLRKREARKSVLILLTDGANTAGEVAPRQAADLAAQENIKIYTVGVGSESPYLDQSAQLDEDTLRYIANTTGGRYFRARDPRELAQIYKLLDTLEPVEQEPETLRPVSSYYHWPLAGALALSLMLALIRILSAAPVVNGGRV